jgi:4-hydroxybenzoate polyprenyltransferase
MNIQHAPTAMTESRERHSYAHLQGRWLLLARGTWLTLVVLTLGIFFASLPVYIALLQTPCAGAACGYQQLTSEQAGTLKGIGLFPDVYTAYRVTLTLALMMGGGQHGDHLAQV